jgi:hypothetical protein
LKIIYIIGSGRSGTTLLDILLGNELNIFSAGELNRYLKRKGIPHSPRDKGVETFWNDVKLNLDIDFEKLHRISEKLEYHSGIYKSFLISKKAKKDYDDFNIRLFSHIFDRSQTTYIVDSSKYPLRALALSKIFNQNISYIYIKRNPSDIVDSFQKKTVEQPSKSRLNAHLYVFVVNVLANVVYKYLNRNHKCVVVNYDKLISNPLGEFHTIENELGISLNDVKNKMVNNQPFEVGSLFDGNRLRLDKEIKIRNSKKKGKTASLTNVVLMRLHKIFWY